MNEDLEVAVREKGMRLRLFDWQSCAERALTEWVSPASEPEMSELERKALEKAEASIVRIPPGKRAILVPDVLEEQYIKLLEASGEAFADVIRADRGLDKLEMELKRAKLKKIG